VTTQLIQALTRCGGSPLRVRVASTPSDNTSVLSSAIKISSSELLVDKYATGVEATRNRIVFLSDEKTKRVLAAAALVTLRPPSNAPSFDGARLRSTPTGECFSTMPPATDRALWQDPASCSVSTLTSNQTTRLKIER